MRAKGLIGFKGVLVEVKPGYYQTMDYEKPYFMQVLRASTKIVTQTDSSTDNVQIGNKFSVVMDAFLRDHLFSLKWLEWNNSKWKIQTAEVNNRRVIITCKETWNG